MDEGIRKCCRNYGKTESPETEAVGPHIEPSDISNPYFRGGVSLK